MCSDRCGGVVSAEPIGDDEWAKVIKKRAEAAGLALHCSADTV
jgi:hypothetical protein